MQEENSLSDLNISFFIKIFIAHLCITAIVLASLLMFFNNFKIADLSPEALTCLPESVRIYDNNDNMITTASGKQNRIFINLSDLSVNTRMAFIAAEDNRFFSHNGIDVKRVFGALWANIKAGYYKEGGSTISQQLIKNSHLTAEKKLTRKLQEAILAIQLESRYSKDEILGMYLNYIYFGNGSYGIQVAALNYYGKNASDLSIAEAASLAGIIKSPTNYSPYTNYNNFINRRNFVIDEMYNLGFISQEQCNNAKSEQPQIIDPQGLDDRYSYIIDKVLLDSADASEITIDDLLNGGYHIYTTIDTTISSFVYDIKSSKNVFPDEKTECAIVVLDTKSGAILSLVGGRNYTTRFGFDRATMAKRSPGSTIKPLLVYAPAIENKILTAASVVKDEKKSFGDYCPSNFNNKYYGNVTVRDSLIKSLNVPAVEILSMIGVENAKEIMVNMGFKFAASDNSLALALGGLTNGITPLELASCYQCMANSGVLSPTHSIRFITDANNNIIYENSISKKKVISEETSFLISDILRDAAKKNGSAFSTIPEQISVKTGTASYGDIGNSDIWVAAYDSNYTIIVWEGYDKTDANNHFENSITGSKYPSIIAANLFADIYDHFSPPAKQNVPSGLVTCQLDKDSLKNGEILLATQFTPKKSVISEYFIKGTEPTEESQYYSLPKACPIFLDDTMSIPIITLTPLNNYTYYHLYCIKNGNYELLRTFNGEAGESISYFDTSALDETDIYIKHYVIIPEHMYVKSNDGSALIGNPSDIVTTTVNPNYNQATPAPSDNDKFENSITP